MGIKFETQKEIMPDMLRQRYGNALGNELYFLLNIIKKDDDTIRQMLRVLDDLGTPTRREELIKAVWKCYYEDTANSLLIGTN